MEILYARRHQADLLMQLLRLVLTIIAGLVVGPVLAGSEHDLDLGSGTCDARTKFDPSDIRRDRQVEFGCPNRTDHNFQLIPALYEVPGSPLSRSRDARLPDSVDLRDWCTPTQITNGAGACFQAAVTHLCSTADNSVGAGTLLLPPGRIKVESPISVPCSFVNIIGSGRQATTVSLAFNGDGFIIGGQGANEVRQHSMSDFTITSDTSVRKSGAHVKLNHVYNVLFTAMHLEDAIRGFDFYQTNNVTVRDTVIAPNQAASDYGIYWHAPGDGSARSDTLMLHGVVIEGSWSHATGLRWEGFCQTLVTTGLRILHMDNGIIIENPDASESYVPGFLNAFDLELEGFRNRALTIAAGAEYKFVGSDISNLSGGDPKQGNADQDAVWIGADLSASITRAVSFSTTRIGISRRQGMFSDARNVQLSNVIFYSTSLAGSAAYPALILGSNSQDVQISNLTAEEFGGAGRASHAVRISSGARRVQISNLNARGVLTGSIDNAAGGQVQAVNVMGP